MPELAEVEITRLKLLPAVKGRRILDFWSDWSRGLKAYSSERIADSRRRVVTDMHGRVILNITRRGKVLFFELSARPRARGRADGARTMAVHLRMSGRLLVAPSKSKLASDKWAHFRFLLSGGREIRFIDPRKFGIVWYGAASELSKYPYLKSLGRDARGISKKFFAETLRRKTGMIKAILLRQDVIAGIGNIIADESLWLAKIHPKARAADLGQAELTRLHRSLAKTIAAMLSAGGTSLRDWSHPDGKLGGYQEKRKIYGKAGSPCPSCKTNLERLLVGGRGTTVCPKCQTI